jgi:hypothetical protein
MNAWRNRLRIFLGFWIMAGLVVLGINGYALMSLLDEPLAGHSSAVRQVDRGFQQYQRLINTETEKIVSGMELLAHRFAAHTPRVDSSIPVEKKTVETKAEQKANQPTVTLPVLAGIVTRRSSAGQVNRMALLDGGVYSEGEMLQAFTIRKIDAEGVLLAKGKQTWFLKRPEVAYSLSQQ